jgi:shikimate kinase
VGTSEPPRKERVFLTGFMGSGKSSIGPILANTLGYAFADTDREIESRDGRSVTLIFREEGEERFRMMERGVVRDLCARRRIVVALGGGTLMDPVNSAALAEAGVIVYLQASAEQLFRRLQSKGDRPVLRGGDGEQLPPEQLRERIEQLVRDREPQYRRAHVVIATDGTRIGLTVDALVRRLRPLLVPPETLS